MSSDPPTTMTNCWGFDVDDLKLNDLFAHSKSLNQIVLINPEDPVSLPKGFIAWDDEVLIEEKGTQLWVKKIGVLAILDSTESALIAVTSNAKLEKNDQGFLLMCLNKTPILLKN